MSMGQIPWNKGKTGVYSKESLMKMSIAASLRKPQKRSKAFGRKMRQILKGIPKSEAHKQKMRENHADFTGEKHPRWKGGIRKHPDGYIYVYSPNHPFKSKNSAVMQHRLVMEKHLGRYLDPKEVVHHRNGIRADNRIKNLTLMTAAEHCLLHRQGKQRLQKHKGIL